MINYTYEKRSIIQISIFIVMFAFSFLGIETFNVTQKVFLFPRRFSIHFASVRNRANAREITHDRTMAQ